MTPPTPATGRVAPVRPTAVLVRSAYGAVAVEWFLIVAITTILVTRAYLALTGYPQVGGGNLHIAHALWGGALMMLALITGWLFLGAVPRVVAVIMGGIGFGLFLDEVGKFVTRDNDYFYGPSAEIMYILVVLILLISRIVRDVRKPTTAEALANAASIAADGVAHGLPARRREQATELLSFAEDRGGDPALVANIRGVLASSADTPDRLMQWRDRAIRLVPGFLRSPRWVSIVGWGLAFLSAVTVVAGTLSFYFHEGRRGDVDIYLELSRSHIATWILLISGVITLALTLPAMIARRRGATLWPLRSLRLGALVFTLSNALVDFALEGFGALANLALGLFALSVIAYHLSQAQVVTAAGDHDNVHM
ncbi:MULTISPECIES: hypothetical protein [unclassified Gordonia (in: high G+C Gram-positive bacteria)]|uniref:hypothetical protein n=1 Tax=unclassified Gordonia (in: high G+C Gram-positive bacteria) TaxID=2657482 RepID=UPI001F108665|nr:hypothetical protein [Gordonia sp. ABSL49_1]MCH5643229.1 hypothetical protein [Gordonia sp. ABSL49_1]